MQYNLIVIGDVSEAAVDAIVKQLVVPPSGVRPKYVKRYRYSAAEASLESLLYYAATLHGLAGLRLSGARHVKTVYWLALRQLEPTCFGRRNHRTIGLYIARGDWQPTVHRLWHAAAGWCPTFIIDSDGSSRPVFE